MSLMCIRNPHQLPGVHTLTLTAKYLYMPQNIYIYINVPKLTLSERVLLSAHTRSSPLSLYSWSRAFARSEHLLTSSRGMFDT